MFLFLLLLLCAGQVFNVQDYGAKGDGVTNNTGPLQTTINSIAKTGGGRMLFPANSGTYVTGSLWLTSNIIVDIQPGVTLLGSLNFSDYPQTYSRSAGTMELAPASLLNGGECLSYTVPLDPYTQGDQCTEWTKLTNVTITGGGVIDGSGAPWWVIGGDQRPCLLGLYWIDGLEVSNLTLQNSPMWNVHPTFSTNIVITGLNITAPYDSPNTDGIDPDSCTNVYIANCIIDVGDDCIAIKSGKDLNGRLIGMPTQNVTVEKMTYKHGHGVSIGSEMSGDIRDVVIRDSVCVGTDRAVRVKTCIGRGGVVENIFYSNLTVSDVAMVLSINMYYTSCNSSDQAIPTFRNITVTTINAASATQAGEFLCLPQSPCTALEVDNVVIASYQTNYNCTYAYGTQTKNFPAVCLLPPDHVGPGL